MKLLYKNYIKKLRKQEIEQEEQIFSEVLKVRKESKQ